jgi:C1A family cysteine protease
VLETQEKIRTNNLPILSEQQIVDCDHDYVYGCDGGLTSSALYWIKKGNDDKSHPILTEVEYPYVGKDNTCTVKAQASGVSVDQVYEVESYSVASVMAAVN